MHSPNIGKAAARIADGCFCTRFASEKEKACIALVGVGAFFFFAVNVKKDLLVVFRALRHIAHYFHGLLGIYVAVPDELQISQRVARIIARVYREEEPSPVAEARI